MSWLAEPAAWPASASGSTASTLSAASATIVARRRATDAPTATTSARPMLIAATRRTSIERTNCWNWAPKEGSSSLVPEASAKDRTSPTSPATTHTTAAPEAQRVAVTRRFVAVVSGMIVAASTSRPTVIAAATSWTARTTGSPQRTSVPGSGSPGTGAAMTPVSSPAGHHHGDRREHQERQRRPRDRCRFGASRWPWVPA